MTKTKKKKKLDGVLGNLIDQTKAQAETQQTQQEYVQQYKPDTLEAAVACLRASESAHQQVLARAMTADAGALYPADHVMLGVAQRSLMLIAGFVALVEQSNAVCAVPLLRLQLDNIMRFNALWLVRDPKEVLNALLSEKPFNKLKSRDGNEPLTDRYLAEQLSKRHPWVSEVYKRTSGFIHLSMPGLMSGVVGIGDATSRDVQFAIGPNAGRIWTDEEKKEAVDAFIAATSALMYLFVSWVITKEKVASQRATSQNR
jgi:hypothetical protein